RGRLNRNRDGKRLPQNIVITGLTLRARCGSWWEVVDDRESRHRGRRVGPHRRQRDGASLVEVRARLHHESQEVDRSWPESSMRRIKYQRYEFHDPDPEDRKAPLYAFVYDVPYLGSCGIFPPRHILNWI